MTLLVTLIILTFAVCGYMTAWFFVARVTDRTDVVDSAWGLGFIYIAWLAFGIAPQHTGPKTLAACFVSIWGLRLFLHIFSRTIHKSEDYRYVAYRQKWGVSFWSKAYVRIFLVQGLLLLAISSVTIAIMQSDLTGSTALTQLGFIIWAFGIAFEAISDWQLRQFMRTKRAGDILSTGLWRYSRHPNYFGEVTAWWGGALVAVGLGEWWGIIGALLITFLITMVSGIPPLERHYQDNPAYSAYKKRTSIFFPQLPRH